MSYTMGSLFAGIGGFDLGFERAGFKTVWQVEIDPYAQKVLAKNFPEAERFGDIRECGRHNLKPVDVICGGFPCQDISNAGKRAGIEGERSGLWSEMHRIIRELRPQYVVVENVAALLGRGMGVVLGDLAEIGYDAEWEIISAADVGAAHLRERVWIVAHPISQRYSRPQAEPNANTDSQWNLAACEQGWGPVAGEIVPSSETMANPAGERSGEEGEFQRERPAERIAGRSAEMAYAYYFDAQGLVNWCDVPQDGEESREGPARSRHAIRGGFWSVEPAVGRVVDGLSPKVDELRGLGNAVVPQIPEMIARRIKQALEAA